MHGQGDRSQELLRTADGETITCAELEATLGPVIARWRGTPEDLVSLLISLLTKSPDDRNEQLRTQDIAAWMVRQTDGRMRDAGMQILWWLVGRGCTWAMYNLAVEYTIGPVCTRDFALANSLLHKVTEQAHAEGLLLGMAWAALADNHARGRGVPADAIRAQSLYERAAEFGNPEAAFNAALFYEVGHGGSPDYLRAAYFYELAIHRDLKQATIKLACLHVMKAFPGADPALGKKMLQDAARNGDVLADDALKMAEAHAMRQ